MSCRPTSNEKLVAIGLVVLAVVSPLLIDRKPGSESEEEDDAVYISSTTWLPLVLVVLMGAISMSGSLGKNLGSCDPYWIFRLCGSSYGILLLLVVLALVLRCKSSLG